MKILVTGGCGFIGTHLIGALLDDGNEIVVLDSSEKKPASEKAAFVRGDIRDTDDVRRAARGCQAVFHLAAVADARSCNEDLVYATNFLGAKNVFDAAKENSARVIFASSAAVYGNGDVPAREDSPCNPISQYGKSKLRAERYLQQQTQEHFIARLFNVYGPGGKGAVNRFCRQITNFEDVTVYGNGLQTRDYVHVSDVVDALILGLNNNGLYNVGGGQDISTTTLIDKIHGMTRCKPTVQHSVPVAGEISRSRADISRLTQTGWKPRIGLDDGIKTVLDSIGFQSHF